METSDYNCCVTLLFLVKNTYKKHWTKSFSVHSNVIQKSCCLEPLSNKLDFQLKNLLIILLTLFKYNQLYFTSVPLNGNLSKLLLKSSKCSHLMLMLLKWWMIFLHKQPNQALIIKSYLQSHCHRLLIVFNAVFTLWILFDVHFLVLKFFKSINKIIAIVKCLKSAKIFSG